MIASGKNLRLDRMEIEDVGTEPVRLAAAIHSQLGMERGRVPVEAIARAVDIQEIRIERLDNLEGALITSPERDRGSILVNGNADARRRAFTVAHELGHFLNVRHVPTEGDGFRCSRGDIQWNGAVSKALSPHQRQEREANRFAIELLAPRKHLKRDLDRDPNLEWVLAIARDFEISREAAARRYVELHPARIAIAFSSGGRL